MAPRLKWRCCSLVCPKSLRHNLVLTTSLYYVGIASLAAASVIESPLRLWALLEIRARICKRFRSPFGIDSEESVPPAYFAWRTGTTSKVVVPAHMLGIDSWALLKVY